MANPEVTKIYRCTHSYTHPNLGRMLRKGKRYVCKNIDQEHDLITMSGVYGDGVNCSRKFFEEHFEEVDEVDNQHKTLTLTRAEADWIKFFFKEYINDIADLDGGTDYESLLSISEKIEQL